MTQRNPPLEHEDADGRPPIRDTAAMRALRSLLERAVKRVKSGGELAQRLHVAPSHVIRMRKGLVGAGVETLWDLAETLDEDPVAILRVCGRMPLAERIDRLRQGLAPRPCSQLCDKISRLSGDDRDRVLNVIVERLLIDTAATGMILPATAAPATRSER